MPQSDRLFAAAVSPAAVQGQAAEVGHVRQRDVFQKAENQTKDVYQELVAAGTEVLLDEYASDILEASL